MASDNTKTWWNTTQLKKKKKKNHKDGQQEMLIPMQGRPHDKIKASTTAKSIISSVKLSGPLLPLLKKPGWECQHMPHVDKTFKKAIPTVHSYFPVHAVQNTRSLVFL